MKNISSVIDMWNYPTNIGRLVINLHSIEVVIRLFLSINEVGSQNTIRLAQSVRSFEINQEVDENKFTNYDTLKTLINEYNKIISSYSYNDLVIDIELVKLRDAMAHGRAFYLEQYPPYTTMLLLKFSNPRENIVSHKPIVVLKELMTKKWLDKNIKWTRNEYKKVVEACKRVSKIKQ